VQERSVIERIHGLAQKVAALEGLPAQVNAVELQILQLREEVRAEFSATRGEMQGTEEGLRGEMREMGEGLRGEISTVYQELVALITHTSEETRREMRILHEDLKSTIKTIGERGR